MGPLALVVAIGLWAPPEPTWTEVFRGRPDFGHCTRVFALKDRIIFFDSPPITASDGGDIYVLKDTAVRPAKVFSVQEQGVHRIFRLGRQLAVPGTDAMEDWSMGNYYLSDDQGETWRKVRNIPNGVHVFDMCVWRGKWYVGFALPNGAAVMESADAGKTWRKGFEYLPKNSFGEALMVLPLSDGLYAHVVTQWGTSRTPEALKADFYRYDGREWTPLKLFPQPGACWNYRLDGDSAFLGQGGHGYRLTSGKLTALQGLDGKNVADFEFPTRALVLALAWDGASKKCSVYRASRTRDTVGAFERVVDLPSGLNGASMAIHRDRLYVSAAATGGGRILWMPLAGAVH